MRKIGLLLVVVALLLGFFLNSKAFAALSLSKPSDTAPALKEMSTPPVFLQASGKSKSRAPEPSTIVLFGSGLVGMIMSFLRKTYAIIKRIFDIAASIVALVMFTPLCLLTAIFIKLTSQGPVIFRQIRVGQDGKLFEIYKFRTMCVDAERETGPIWARENDSRLTPVGHILRTARIDEIPQFFNVLKGEMSIVGPRPERPVFVNKFVQEIPHYNKRLAVKPGITGLAQVRHRYDETIADVKKKIKYDILYIKRFCLWTDLRILMRTVRVVLTGAGAR